MEAVGMLAGGVAHDFNNLLTIITGYSQLILNNLGLSDPNRHSVEQIMKAGERAAALTRQLLAFSRRQVLQPKVLDLNKLVTSLSTMLQRLIGEDIDLRLVLPPELGRVSADPGQMEQVLMNLVVNARDAMPKGGILTIETANVELDDEYASRHIAVKPGHVRDAGGERHRDGHGRGHPGPAVRAVFHHQGQPAKGTGLGLSTVFGIVKQSGGSIEVYSEPGRGTVRQGVSAAHRPAGVAGGRTQRRQMPARGSETILLVEDDEMVRTLVRETLRREGYKVLDAPSPMEARRMADSSSGPIHLLITDVVMPKISGRELAEQLLRAAPGHEGAVHVGLHRYWRC